MSDQDKPDRSDKEAPEPIFVIEPDPDGVGTFKKSEDQADGSERSDD